MYTKQKSIERLLTEAEEHGKIIVAVDFDNTIYDYHSRGLDFSGTISAVKRAIAKGHEVYVFTANSDHKLVSETFCNIFGIVPAINESSLDHLFPGRKPFYSILLDDRAGLEEAVEILETVCGA